jgi:hypothetical protein
MQEDIEHRSVTLAIKGAKLTEQMLRSAIKKLLAARKNGRNSPNVYDNLKTRQKPRRI